LTAYTELTLFVRNKGEEQHECLDLTRRSIEISAKHMALEKSVNGNNARSSQKHFAIITSHRARVNVG
jgi:hypothetical protein